MRHDVNRVLMGDLLAVAIYSHQMNLDKPLVHLDVNPPTIGTGQYTLDIGTDPPMLPYLAVIPA